jgi:hypothetical protein
MLVFLHDFGTLSTVFQPCSRPYHRKFQENQEGLNQVLIYANDVNLSQYVNNMKINTEFYRPVKNLV